MNNSPKSLRTVATGLRLVYAGLCLLVFSVVWPYLIGPIASQLDMRGETWLIASAPALLVVAIILDTLGRLFCLVMPAARAGTMPIIYASVALSLSALLISAMQLGSVYFGLAELPDGVEQLQTLLAIMGSVLFLVFLKNVAQDIQEPALARLAVGILILGIVTVVTAIGLEVMMVTANTEFGWLRLALPVLVIILLVMYGNLLTNLRQAVSHYASAKAKVG